MYVFVDVPFCAVTIVVITLVPTFRLIVPLAIPEVTALPFTVMLAFAWVRVGVNVTDDTEFATDAV